MENWIFVDSLLYGGIGLSSGGTTTGTEEQIMSSNSTTEVDEIDFNKYVISDLTEGSFLPSPINEIIKNHKPLNGKESIKVGIIDTGVDLLHEGLNEFLFLSEEDFFNEEDDDENCYTDNVIGWNFVADNNNVSDDHGHGSHVAGIIVDHSRRFDDEMQTVIIPYKTHDIAGLANLFDVTCAMYLAIKDDVSVVNCSWGFYGDGGGILKDAIELAWEHDITVVAATGNDYNYLSDLQQFPACYKIPNVISVGSYDHKEKVDSENLINAGFSNYGAKFVDVLAHGVDVLSTVPYNDYQYKTGTSMAAPAVSGHAVHKYAIGYVDPIEIKEVILHDAVDYEHLEFYVLDGNVLLDSWDEEGGSISDYIYTPQGNEQVNGQVAEMEVSYTLSGDRLLLQFNSTYSNVNLYLFNNQGQIVMNGDLLNVKTGDLKELVLNSLQVGIYYLRINEEVIKIVFNK